MSKIVYGNYTIANAIGSIVGYATQEDFSIKETADSDNKVFGGVTRMETYDNHGKTASGTVALTDEQKAERIKIGHRIQIVQPDGTTRYFIVDQWDIDADTATGGAVASVSAHSFDSMLDEYAIGPRDPDTGEPLSGKVKFVVSIHEFPGAVTFEEMQGATFGAFAYSDLPTWDGSSSVGGPVDMSKAIATARVDGAQLTFIVPASVSTIFPAGNFDGKVYAGEEFDQGLVNYNAVNFKAYTIADASDSSSASA